MSLNTITLVGHAGRDPEIRFFESGTVVSNFTLAVNKPGKDEAPDCRAFISLRSFFLLILHSFFLRSSFFCILLSSSFILLLPSSSYFLIYINSP